MQPESLYHYCPSDAFVAIVESRLLRLSSLALGNDWMEGRLSFRALRDLLPDESLKLSQKLRLIPLFSMLEETQVAYGLGFCTSAESDLLSQWRGYARDGTGVAIGFRRSNLEELVTANREGLPLLTLVEVQYGEKPPREALASLADKVMKSIERGALDSVTTNGKYEGDAASELFSILVSVKLDAYRFKSEAFREEREYRLLATSRTNDAPPRRDYLRHRAAGERLVAYAALGLGAPDSTTISEVVLGPKHATPREVVEEFLELNGFPNVAVRKSAASYR